MFFLCGERGIRTPGTSQFNGFQDRRNRPLCHLSFMFGNLTLVPNICCDRIAAFVATFPKSAAKVQQILDIRKFFAKKMF